jgi:hypothetical protein
LLVLAHFGQRCRVRHAGFGLGIALELVAGYWTVQTPTLADAVAWAKRVPFESGEVEQQVH